MNKALALVFLAFSFFTSALQAQHNHATAKSQKQQTQSSVANQGDKQFQTQLAAVYKDSQQLKEALISSDATKTQQAASTVKKALSKVDMNLLKGNTHTEWMSFLKEMNTSLDKIESENKIKIQRKQFAIFSDALYKSIKSFGLVGEQAYYQYCPMALEGEGAYWLSDSRQIRNPYLGDKMLTCGSTKETFQ